MGIDTKFLKNRQMVLLFVGLIPGILAAAKIFSPSHATLALIALFLLSRRFASAQQKQFELEEARAKAMQQIALDRARAKAKKGKGNWIALQSKSKVKKQG